ncbi:TonB-dependent receptor [Thalassotalea euphylliae]|uniref:TonB-dependent receptor n=1 Tax=Thalassotalea euphylliae TaxID=1655234 RepID=A0A3E0U3H0_9GAMM|nr:TonB-dependent receptor [Thalassotalea euphylliae]REL31319.1 TonB-dependent receptor [Thalassotalea euphylliae]
MNIPTPLTKLSLSIALSCSVAAVAQESATDADPQAKAIERITVTARKRAEGLQDIPLAVSALDEAAIARNAINTLADIQAQVPALTIYAARGTSSTATAYIRGVGQSDPLFGVEPGVGIYLDDVYLARPQAALLDMLDVARVEVLRGPQGTLYGRNTIGGAIKYITRKPTDEFSFKGDIAVGSYDQLDGRLAASGAIVDNKLLASVALGNFDRDGFGENRLTGEDVSDKTLFTGRVNLLWLVNDNLTASLMLDQTRDRSNVRGAQRMVPNILEPFFSGMPPLAISTDRYDVDNGFDIQVNDTDSQGAALTLTWDNGGDWQIKSVTAWRDGDTKGAIDFDVGPQPIADVDADYFDEQLSQELQVNYSGDNLQAVFGVYWLDAEAGGEVRNRFGIPLALLGLAPPTLIPGPILFQYGASGGQVDTDAIALYGDASWQLDQRWRLNLGLRANREKKTATVLNQGFTDDSFSVPNGMLTANFNNEETWHNVSPRISLDYQPNQDLLVYGSIAKGFKSGGFNIRANTVEVPSSANPYQPESVLTYELGVKPSLSDQFQFSAAYFYSDYEDIQLSIFTGIDTDNDGTNDQFFGDFTNAGEGRIQGLEFEYQWLINRQLRISGNAAYMDAEYSEFLSGGQNIADSQEFTNIPRWSFAVNGQWQTVLSDWGELTATVNYSWRDQVQPVTNLSDILLQPAYGVWNASLIITPNNSAWTIAIEGKNLADKEYRTTGYDLRDAGFPIVTGYYGDPRTVTFRLTYQY